MVSYSLTHSLTYSLTYLLTHSLGNVQQQIRDKKYIELRQKQQQVVRLLTDINTEARILSEEADVVSIRSLTHLLTYFTHSLTHSFIRIQVLPDNQFYTLTPQETLDVAQDVIEEYTKDVSKIPTRLFVEFIRNIFYASTFMTKDVNDANYEVDEYNR